MTFKPRFTKLASLGAISNRTGVRPNVIVVGKNIAKSSSFENEVLDLVKEAQELKLRGEAKLAKWFADTELSGECYFTCLYHCTVGNPPVHCRLSFELIIFPFFRSKLGVFAFLNPLPEGSPGTAFATVTVSGIGSMCRDREYNRELKQGM